MTTWSRCLSDCKTREQSQTDLVNEALRHGLKQMSARPKRGKPFRTRSVDLGQCRVGNIDNVVEALLVAEGDSFR
jgi:hypothetical protein